MEVYTVRRNAGALPPSLEYPNPHTRKVLNANPELYSLLVSIYSYNGLVLDSLSSGKQWTLGSYTDEFGGMQVRGKRTFGIYVPLDVEEEEVPLCP